MFKSLENRHTKPFELIHMDLAGPMQTKSLQGNLYHYLLIDDYTHFKWAFFLQTKDQTFEQFKMYVAFISTQFNATVHLACLDCGGEFMSTDFSDYMKTKGILHELTAPNTPQKMVLLNGQTTQ